MTTGKIKKGKRTPAKRTKKVVSTPFPEEAAIALALVQVLGTPHDEEFYRLTIQRKEFDP